MPDLVETIKRIAMDALRASDPVEITYGEVVGLSPLTVQCGDKLRLKGNALLLGKTAAAYIYETGDRLILLRAQGGQRYFVLDKAVPS